MVSVEPYRHNVAGDPIRRILISLSFSLSLSPFILRDNSGSARVFRYLLIVHLSASL